MKTCFNFECVSLSDAINQSEKLKQKLKHFCPQTTPNGRFLSTNRTKKHKTTSNEMVLCDLGRVFTYLNLGLLFGIFGKGIAMAGFQQTLSIVLGALIIVVGLAPSLLNRNIPLSRPISVS